MRTIVPTCLARSPTVIVASAGAGGRPSRGRKARKPGVFEILDMAPPPTSLGIHSFHPLTHNGDEIEVEGSSYIVQTVIQRFKLVRGRYQRVDSRLEVRPTGRYFYEVYLEACMEQADNG
jgi:hypothetical protein